MTSSLDLSSFFPIYPVIDSPDEWNARVARDLATLDSLAAINLNRKYYYDKRDDKFYQSNWAIADTIKGWIGNWPASYLAKGEEVLYRNLWGLSYKDSIEGLLKVKDRIEVTLAIASTTLEIEDQKFPVNIPQLNQQILAIQKKFADVKTGLQLLKWTYEDSTEKREALQRVIVVFFRDSEKFIGKVLSQISAKLKPPEIAVSSNELQKSASVSSPPDIGSPIIDPGKIPPEENEPVSPVLQPSVSAPPPATRPASIPAEIPEPLPSPFAYPKREVEKTFNSDFQANLATMKAYMENHRAQFEAQSAEPRRYKRKDMGTPWSVQVTPEGIPYMHHHISIVPPKQRGAFKKDKLAFHPVYGVTAKLATKMLRPDSVEIAKNEEKYLRFFSQNKHPHIVETYDVIWVTVKEEIDDFWWGLKTVEYKKQIIYQRYYAELRNSLPRLINQPDKIKKILLGVLKGLAFMHAKKIVHCDIKASNIFLDEEGKPVIGDMGCACDEGESIGIRGTPAFMDPNIHTKSGNSKATPTYDIWSFGMMMYGLLKKYPQDKVEDVPWEWLKNARGFQLHEFNRTIKDKLFPEPPKEDVWMHACWECLQLDPAKRPTAQQLVDRLSG